VGGQVTLNGKQFAQLTDDELHERMMVMIPGSVNSELAKAELEHRDRKRTKKRRTNWIGIFALGLAAGGMVASAWPHLVWWVQHGFRFR
jgi:hypothetical protein